MSLPLAARRVAAVSLLGAAGVLLAQQAAFAHVTVTPNTGTPGGYTRVAFNVPNEKPDASTVKLEVVLPADHPLASVSVQPVPGWTVTREKTKLPQPVRTDDGEVTEAVTSIVWQGGQVQPGQFQQFLVSLGPLPKDTGQLVFKALQTYSDGSVVRWIDLPDGSGAEPEHPAPTLSLAAAPAAAAPEPAAAQGDSTARALGGGGLALAIAACGWAWQSRRRAKQAPAAPSPAAHKPKVGV
ncbi:YcnI family copper-binding membrane protein [Amycolatopsis sp. NPDC005003]